LLLDLCTLSLCDPFSRAPRRRFLGAMGMRKKDTEIPPERVFI
jgi:hypothetical protein